MGARFIAFGKWINQYPGWVITLLALVIMVAAELLNWILGLVVGIAVVVLFVAVGLSRAIARRRATS